MHFIICNLKFHKNLPFCDPILRQLNAVHNFTTFFSKIHSNIIIQFIRTFPKWYFFFLNTFKCFSFYNITQYLIYYKFSKWEIWRLQVGQMNLSHMPFFTDSLFHTIVVEFQFAKSWLRSHLSSDLLDSCGELANCLLHQNISVAEGTIMKQEDHDAFFFNQNGGLHPETE